jgi:hypothetical protein
MRLFEIPQVIRTPQVPAPPPVVNNPGAAGSNPDATIVKQVPLQTFGGDNLVGASADITFDATLVFSDRCTGLLLQAATGTVQVQINGGALRTVVSDQAINDASIRQVRVVTGVASSVILQFHGV